MLYKKTQQNLMCPVTDMTVLLVMRNKVLLTVICCPKYITGWTSVLKWIYHKHEVLTALVISKTYQSSIKDEILYDLQLPA